MPRSAFDIILGQIHLTKFLLANRRAADRPLPPPPDDEVVVIISYEGDFPVGTCVSTVEGKFFERWTQDILRFHLTVLARAQGVSSAAAEREVAAQVAEELKRCEPSYRTLSEIRAGAKR